MEDFYSSIVVGGAAGSALEGFHQHHHHHQFEGSLYDENPNNNDNTNNNYNDNNNELMEGLEGFGNSSYQIMSQISSHPLYPQLVSAYISCQKVGASPEIATLLEEIIGQVENQRLMGNFTDIDGADPQLDEFMESYCRVLHRYKEELSKPFDEATVFLRDMESQLNNLCRDNPTPTPPSLLGSATPHAHSHSPDEVVVSDDELSHGYGEAKPRETFGFSSARDDRDVKEILRNKYSGYLSSLKKEFLKKKKNGNLPKDARTALLEWWNSHYRWPYPTEEEKLKLSESTGLDPKQINNWFINQRKRHWKPSEDMKFALMEGVSGGMPEYIDEGDEGDGRGLQFTSS